MQTFIPLNTSFEDCYRVLDKRRANCQVKEACQILSILAGETQAWKNHPAVIAWTFNYDALAEYIFAGVRVLKEKNVKHDLYLAKVIRLAGHEHDLDIVYPAWWNDEAIHQSHRARLLQKDFSFYSQYDWHDDIPSWENIQYIWPVPITETTYSTRVIER